MFSFRLQESAADPLFYRVSGNDKLIVALYVDDGLVAAMKKISIEEFLSRLKAEFKITAESVGYFLNVLIDRLDNDSIVISQKRYYEDILRRFNGRCEFGFDSNREVSTDGEHIDAETTNAPYREAVGCLMYLAVATHPDITFAELRITIPRETD